MCTRFNTCFLGFCDLLFCYPDLLFETVYRESVGRDPSRASNSATGETKFVRVSLMLDAEAFQWLQFLQSRMHYV